VCDWFLPGEFAIKKRLFFLLYERVLAFAKKKTDLMIAKSHHIL
jgi:hypothetical protein